MWKYVLLKGDVYPLDTQEGVQAALAALWLSGDPHTEVWEKEDLDTSGTRTGNLLFRPVRLTINARYRMAEFWNALRKSLSAGAGPPQAKRLPDLGITIRQLFVTQEESREIASYLRTLAEWEEGYPAILME